LARAQKVGESEKEPFTVGPNVCNHPCSDGRKAAERRVHEDRRPAKSLSPRGAVRCRCRCFPLGPTSSSAFC
jgi:hypothetical protein